MKFGAVSTFNREGLDLYGRRMMASFRRNWPVEVALTVYAEGWQGPAGLATVDLLAASPWLAAFKARHARRRFRDYRWDAVRFSHKVAALCHAASVSDADVLIWLDGDIVTHARVSIDDLAGLAPKGEEWIAWLDRVRMHPECGFYMLNCRHSRHRQMMEAFERMYRDDALFGLREWHDSYVLQQVVAQSGIVAKSLSGAGARTTHPLVNGPLGRWFDHLKGGRKLTGKSMPSDLKVARTEGYWR